MHLYAMVSLLSRVAHRIHNRLYLVAVLCDHLRSCALTCDHVRSVLLQFNVFVPPTKKQVLSKLMKEI